MTKHSPGPWECRPSNEYGWTYEITNKEGNDDTQAEANARLIAAAPDLLEALLYWKNECSGAEPSISVFNQMVDAAIARATHKEGA